MPVISPLPAIKALPKAVSALVLHPAQDVVLAAAGPSPQPSARR